MRLLYTSVLLCNSCRHAFAADSLLSLVYQIVRGNFPPIPADIFSEDMNILVNSLLIREASERPSLAQVRKKQILGTATVHNLVPVCMIPFHSLVCLLNEPGTGLQTACSLPVEANALPNTCASVQRSPYVCGMTLCFCLGCVKSFGFPCIPSCTIWFQVVPSLMFYNRRMSMCELCLQGAVLQTDSQGKRHTQPVT